MSLPTPAPSSDIAPGKRTSFSTIDSTFSLPPAAITNPTANSNSSSSSSTSSIASAASDSSFRPLSPIPAQHSRRRGSAAIHQNSAAINASVSGGYTLPPPPTRSRKIIQMKPRTTQPDSRQSSAAAAPISTTISPNLTVKAPQPSPSLSGQAVPKTSAPPAPITPSTSTGSGGAGTKRKAANSSSSTTTNNAGPTTAAGRKIARKTAHSLIERRRRSKMNEEFGVLKDMVPACAGQDMHKLQVLSASIEYMKYLQQCLADLRAVHARCPPQPSPVSPFKSRDVDRGTLVEEEGEEDEDEDEDEDMIDADEAAVLTPAQRQHQHQHKCQKGYSSSQHPSVSPAILPNNRMTPSLLPSTHASPAISSSQIRAVNYTYTPTFGGSALPSPVYDSRPTSSATMGGGGHHSSFKLTSPALRPQNQNQDGADNNGQSADRTPTENDDHEATTALLMLNTDRRSWSGPSGGNGSGQGSAGGGTTTTRGDGGRGMSVRDLLSG